MCVCKFEIGWDGGNEKRKGKQGTKALMKPDTVWTLTTRKATANEHECIRRSGQYILVLRISVVRQALACRRRSNLRVMARHDLINPHGFHILYD